MTALAISARIFSDQLGPVFMVELKIKNEELGIRNGRLRRRQTWQFAGHQAEVIFAWWFLDACVFFDGGLSGVGGDLLSGL